MTTKILALTDALGNLVRFAPLPGQRFDTAEAAPLIEGVEFSAPIAGTAFDSNDIIADLNDRGAKLVISQHPRRASPLQIDTEMDKSRHLIENFFRKLKEFKRIARRAGKPGQSFAAMLHPAAIINSRGISTEPMLAALMDDSEHDVLAYMAFPFQHRTQAAQHQSLGAAEQGGQEAGQRLPRRKPGSSASSQTRPASPG